MARSPPAALPSLCRKELLFPEKVGGGKPMRENRKLEIGGDSCTRQRFLCPASVIENPQPASQPASLFSSKPRGPVWPDGWMQGHVKIILTNSPLPHTN